MRTRRNREMIRSGMNESISLGRIFWVYSVSSLALLALVPLSSAALGTSMDFGALANRASRATGIPWTSNLANVVRLCVAEPGLWLLLVGSAVPTLAALVALASAGDSELWRDWRGRFTRFGSRRAGPRSAVLVYMGLLASIVACQLMVFALRDWLGPGEYARAPLSPGSALASAIMFSALLDQGAVLEEGGWRGFATPLLQRRGISPLHAAVVVGVVWGVWHVPRDVVSGVIERLGALEYLSLFLPAFLLGTVTTSILASFFMNRLDGSLLPAIMVHGLANDAMGLGGFASIEQALTPYHQVTKAIPLCLLALAIIAVAGKRLGLADESGSASPASAH